MPGQEACRDPGAPSAKDLLARLRELVDARPIEGNCPIEWAVAAYFLGDMGALAVLSLRCES